MYRSRLPAMEFSSARSPAPLSDAARLRFVMTVESPGARGVPFVPPWPPALGLLAAAARGVKVRLLLDDFGVSKSGAMVAWLDSHPGIEVRVFNPWASRDSLVGLTIEFLARTKTLNRRMHNKTFIADGRFA